MKLRKKYFFIKKIFKKKIKSKYVLIHLDEKWNDILLINKDFSKELKKFQKKLIKR